MDFNNIQSLSADRLTSLTKSLTYEYDDTLIWTKGNHTFKFGARYPAPRSHHAARLQRLRQLRHLHLHRRQWQPGRFHRRRLRRLPARHSRRDLLRRGAPGQRRPLESLSLLRAGRMAPQPAAHPVLRRALRTAPRLLRPLRRHRQLRSQRGPGRPRASTRKASRPCWRSPFLPLPMPAIPTASLPPTPPPSTAFPACRFRATRPRASLQA